MPDRLNSKAKILAALARAEELSAMEIRERGGLWWIEPLYLYLYALERDGLIKSRIEEETLRKLYRLA